MNRRAFFGGLISILPAATCYKRIWKEIAGTEMPFDCGFTTGLPTGPIPEPWITIIWQNEDGVEIASDSFRAPSACGEVTFIATATDGRTYDPYLQNTLRKFGIISPCTLNSPEPG